MPYYLAYHFTGRPSLRGFHATHPGVWVRAMTLTGSAHMASADNGGDYRHWDIWGGGDAALPDYWCLGAWGGACRISGARVRERWDMRDNRTTEVEVFGWRRATLFRYYV